MPLVAGKLWGVFARAALLPFTRAMARNIFMLTQLVAASPRGNPEGIHIWVDVVVNAETTLGLQSRRVDLDNPIIPLKFFKTALEFAISPHGRRPVSHAMGVTSRPASRKWIASQVREFPQDPNWQHAGIVDEI